MGDISEHLSRSEVACKCGCGFMIADYQTVIMFEQARAFEGGYSVTPNSWCRCKEHNEAVQKKANSKYLPYSSKSVHMTGGACDYPSKNPKALYDYFCRKYPHSGGFGVYKNFVHFDSRAQKARWDWR